jgi:hypothetical protein
MMDRTIAYVRHGRREPLTYEVTGTAGGLILVFDAAGEIGSEMAGMRLQSLPHRLRRPELVVLRGLSEFQRSMLADENLSELFPPSCLLFELEAGPVIKFNPLGTTVPLEPVDAAELQRAVCNAEIRAILAWSDGIWASPDYHFVLPSTEHSGAFLRVGDAMGSWMDTARIADWLLPLLTHQTAILTDTPTLLPLMLELENRALKAFSGARILKRSLPSYHPPREELDEYVSEALLWASEGGDVGSVLCIVSVNASGGYLSRIEKSLQRLADDIRVTVSILVDTNSESDSRALAVLPVRRFPPPPDCELCTLESVPVEIDGQRFTTRVLTGAETLRLAPYKQIVERNKLISELDSANALRVHATRPDHHGHLGIYIEIAAALKNQAFRLAANEALTRAAAQGEIDLFIIPHHGRADVVLTWLKEEGITSQISIVPLAGTISGDGYRDIAKARRILLVDDCIITGQTMRSLLQLIQTVKGEVHHEDYVVLGLALIGRSADMGTWEGIRDCFFIGGRHRLETAMNIFLPDWGRNCPWCIELAAFDDLLLYLDGEDRTYAEHRKARLSEPEGLQSHLFLGADLPPLGSEFSEGTRTTPHSYWGNVRDIGAFVGASAEFQRLRNEWSARPPSLVSRYVFPTRQILQRYRDPVIAAAMLRSAQPRELWSVESLPQIEKALYDSRHFRQHPVFIAELLWAAQRQKLPVEVVRRVVADRLNLLDPTVLKVLLRLLDS